MTSNFERSFYKQFNNAVRREQFKKVSRAKELVKLLERLIKHDHLYTEDKIKEMKQQLHIIKQQMVELEEQTSKGFGKK
jgi:hypothetical protein